MDSDFRISKNTDVEKILLAKALRSKDSALELLSKTTEEMFWDLKHQEIYRVIKTIVHNGQEPDFTVVSEGLKRRNTGESKAVVNTVYLTEMIVHDLDSFASIPTLVKMLEQRTVERKMQRLLSGALQDLNNEKEDVLQELTGELLQLRVGFDNSVFSAAELTKEHFEVLNKRIENGGVAGIPYGFIDLDDYTSGAKPGQLIVVAARTSQGKSAFAENIITNMLLNKKKVYFVSVETGREEIMDRMIGRISGVGHNRLMQGMKDSSEQWDEVSKAFGVVHDFNLTLHDNSIITSDQIFAEATKLKLQDKCDVVVVDYLQLLSDKGLKSDTRERVVAKMSHTLKGLARSLQVPVIVTAQLNRDAAGISSRPQLHHLRESGALEQDADVAILLWRGGENEPNLTHFDVAKNRQGKIGEFDLLFKGETVEFKNITDAYAPIEVLNERIERERGGENWHDAD